MSTDEEAAQHWEKVAKDTEVEAKLAREQGSWTAVILAERAREARAVAARIRQAIAERKAR